MTALERDGTSINYPVEGARHLPQTETPEAHAEAVIPSL
jgi:hypothetical protein